MARLPGCTLSNGVCDESDVEMKKTDLAYMAGFFDGEGCVCISNASRDGLKVTVDIYQCNEWIVRWFQFSFGGSVSLRKARQRGWKPQWRWSIANRKVLPFLKAIRPYLILKKAEADLAIKFQEARVYWGGHGKPIEVLAVEEAQRLLMHQLKDKTELQGVRGNVTPS